MSFGEKWGMPFRQAAPQPVAASHLYATTLDGWGYQIDRASKQFRRRQVDLLKNQQGGPKNQDSLLLPAEVWRRTVQSWHQGSGQRMADRSESLEHRFDSSLGIDPWERWQIKMLPDTRKIATVTATSWTYGDLLARYNSYQAVLDAFPSYGALRTAAGEQPPVLLAVLGPRLVASSGTTLLWFANLADPPTVQSLNSTPLSLTCDGEGVIAALVNGTIVKATSATTLATLATLPGVDFVTYGKDRLVAAAGNVLYDITGVTDGSAVIGHDPELKIHQHPLASFTWVDGCDGLNCIYLIGGVGDRSVVHRLTLKEDATGLAPPIVATPIPDGEIGHAIGSYMGYAFVGTSKGMHFAVPQSGGDLNLGPLIPTQAPVRCFEGQDRFVWYGNSNPFDGYTGLGRVDLTTFTQPLAPAFANDLMAIGVTGGVTSVVTFQDKRVFGVRGVGVFAEDDLLVREGWLTDGQFSYGVVDPKTGVYFQLRYVRPLQGELRLDLSYDDDDKWETVYNFAYQAASGIENVSLQGRQFLKVETRLRFTSTPDRRSGPVVTRWELRAVPVTGRASEWVLPLKLSDTDEINGAVLHRDVIADLDRLVNLVESARMVVYRENTRSWQVNALDYEWQPEMLSERVLGGWQGLFVLRVREIR